MFEYEVDRSGFSVGLFILQLFVVPLVCLVCGLILADICVELLRVVTKSRAVEVLAGWVVYGIMGFCIGFGGQKNVRRLRQSGGAWAWLLPVCVFTWGLLDTLFRDPNHIVSVTIGIPFPQDGDGEAFWLTLVAWPTIATCFYSVGMVRASRLAKAARGASFRRV